jgi:hypothetical protein
MIIERSTRIEILSQMNKTQNHAKCHARDGARVLCGIFQKKGRK